MRIGSVLKAIRWVVAGLVFLPGAFLFGTIALLGARDRAMSAWSRVGLWGLGAKCRTIGTMPPAGSLIATNHFTYIDILALGAVVPSSFIAKGDISKWPVIGWATGASGNIFIDRDSLRNSSRLLDKIAARLTAGERIILFAEGGIVAKDCDVAPFRPMLFEVALRSGKPVIPTAIRYVTPADPSPLCWDKGGLGSHLVDNVFKIKAIEIEVEFAEPIYPTETDTRKSLAESAHGEVCRMIADGKAARGTGETNG